MTDSGELAAAREEEKAARGLLLSAFDELLDLGLEPTYHGDRVECSIRGIADVDQLQQICFTVRRYGLAIRGAVFELVLTVPEEETL